MSIIREDTTMRGSTIVRADRRSVRDKSRKRGVAIWAPLVWSSDSAWLELLFVLGLGGVFLANAAVAVVEPATFQELVGASPVGTLIGGGAWIAPLIAVNDMLIGAAVIATHRVRSLRAPALAWAGVWLLIVTLMKLTTMG